MNDLIGKEITLKIEDAGAIKTFFGRIVTVDSDGFLKFEYKNGKIRYFNMKYVRDASESEPDVSTKKY